MWTVNIVSAEIRTDGKFYIGVNFVSDERKINKQYLISNSKTLAQFKDDLRNEIKGFDYSQDILDIQLGEIDLS